MFKALKSSGLSIEKQIGNKLKELKKSTSNFFIAYVW